MAGRTPTRGGLQEAKALYRDRFMAVRDSKARGKRVVGHFCCMVPAEILTALDLIPFRIQGNAGEPVSQADAHLETCICPFARSCFDSCLKRRYDDLDGMVMPHSCDTIQRLYVIWRESSNRDYFHFLDVPHMVHPSSEAFFRRELERFGKSLEEWTGNSLTEIGLREAIKLHNENRALLRSLYDLRKQHPPLISGVEVTELLVAGMCLPVREFNSLIQSVIGEVKSRRVRPARKGARILLYGTELDDTTFVQLVEDSGANVVIDDLCTGTRSFWQDVDLSLDPWDALAKRYLHGIPCPRTYRPKGKDRETDLESRFAYLGNFIRDFNVNGVILNVMVYCDTTELDAPDVIEYVSKTGTATLHLEDGYLTAGIGQIQTRIQAFLEMIA